MCLALPCNGQVIKPSSTRPPTALSLKIQDLPQTLTLECGKVNGSTSSNCVFNTSLSGMSVSPGAIGGTTGGHGTLPGTVTSTVTPVVTLPAGSDGVQLRVYGPPVGFKLGPGGGGGSWVLGFCSRVTGVTLVDKSVVPQLLPAAPTAAGEVVCVHDDKSRGGKGWVSGIDGALLTKLSCGAHKVGGGFVGL
jgi:hypothetical protein